eukprot:SAG11_NODE_117_length_15962_cov_71.527925_14_plen_181_part_00
MQLFHESCQIAPGPRHGAPFGFSVTRPYEITHPSRAFRAVLDRPLVIFICFYICMVLLRATGRGPSRARRSRLILCVKKQRSRSPCAGPKCVLMTPMHKRHCCPTCEGPPARVYGYVWYLIDPLHIQYAVGKHGEVPGSFFFFFYSTKCRNSYLVLEVYKTVAYLGKEATVAVSKFSINT